MDIDMNMAGWHCCARYKTGCLTDNKEGQEMRAMMPIVFIAMIAGVMVIPWVLFF